MRTPCPAGACSSGSSAMSAAVAGIQTQNMQPQRTNFLVKPGQSFDSKILVPASCIDLLVAQNVVEEIAIATAASGHYAWVPGISAEEQWALLLSAMPDGKQKQTLETQQRKRESLCEEELQTEPPACRPKISETQVKPDVVPETKQPKRKLVSVLEQLAGQKSPISSVEKSTNVRGDNSTPSNSPFWWTKDVFRMHLKINELRADEEDQSLNVLSKRLYAASRMPANIERPLFITK